MSLSTLTQCHPKVCRIQRGDHQLNNLLKEPPPNNQFNWKKVQQASLIAALATSLSQIVSAPLDVSTRTIKKLPPSSPLSKQTLSNMFKVLFQIARNNSIGGIKVPGGISGLFEGVKLHLMKRLPTKTLTVTFFELSTQLMNTPKLNPFQHLFIANISGAAALLLCYPLHMVYYVLRKQISLSKIMQKVYHKPSILYTGSIPALVATIPAVMIDYITYSMLRKQIDHISSSSDHSQQNNNWKAMSTTTMLVLAAAAANVMGGFMSEPFKSVGRKMAVQAVRGGPVPLSSSPKATTTQALPLSLAFKTVSSPKTNTTLASSATSVITKTASTISANSAALMKDTTEKTKVTIKATVNAMLDKGVGEFWSGFQLRSIRYFVSAIVSKATVQQLKDFKERKSIHSQQQQQQHSLSYNLNGKNVYDLMNCSVRINSIQCRLLDKEITLLELPKRGYAAYLINPNTIATYNSPNLRVQQRF